MIVGFLVKSYSLLMDIGIPSVDIPIWQGESVGGATRRESMGFFLREERGLPCGERGWALSLTNH